MTREEAIEEVEVAFDIWESEYDTGNDWSKEHEARDMAIKALEREPSNAVVKNDLAVRPKGHWIYGYTFPDGQYRKCSACKELTKVVAGDGNFCGHCGAKMEGEE